MGAARPTRSARSGTVATRSWLRRQPVLERICTASRRAAALAIAFSAMNITSPSAAPETMYRGHGPISFSSELCVCDRFAIPSQELRRGRKPAPAVHGAAQDHRVIGLDAINLVDRTHVHPRPRQTQPGADPLGDLLCGSVRTRTRDKHVRPTARFGGVGHLHAACRLDPGLQQPLEAPPDVALLPPTDEAHNSRHQLQEATRLHVPRPLHPRALVSWLERERAHGVHHRRVSR